MTDIKAIEDYLCNLCDSVFNDSITCDKLYNPEQRINRAAYVDNTPATIADQNDVTIAMQRLSKIEKHAPSASRIFRKCEKIS